MPRCASRIDLIITGVKAERLRDIGKEDVRAEGVDPWINKNCRVVDKFDGHRMAFARTWDTIHGDGAWDRNDWVFAYTFERVKP
jgi:hypothetical protein